MKKALVTGTSGFVGRHLSKALAKSGWEVIDGARLGQIDAIDGEIKSKLRGVHAVFHLGGIAHRRATSEEFTRVNSRWPVRLYQAACSTGVGDFVMLSSIKVLGDVSETPLSVKTRYAPGDEYALSKVHAEEGLWQARTSGDTSLHIVRPPLIYGPGVKANFLALIKLARIARFGFPLPLGGATAKRSLLSVNNLCDFLLKVPGAESGTFHVADAEDLSVSELLMCLSDDTAVLLDIQPRIMRGILSLLRSGGLYSRMFLPLRLDQSETRMRLQWSPPYDTRSELKAAMRWYVNR